MREGKKECKGFKNKGKNIMHTTTWILKYHYACDFKSEIKIKIIIKSGIAY